MKTQIIVKEYGEKFFLVGPDEPFKNGPVQVVCPPHFLYTVLNLLGERAVKTRRKES